MQLNDALGLGHFLKQGIDRFDAGFFSTTPEEARGMDPTQRMLLELAYEGLENAGLKIDQVADQPMSCYVGACQHDYWDLEAYDMDSAPKCTATGTGPALLSNRISWFFNLKGHSKSKRKALVTDLTCFCSLPTKIHELPEDEFLHRLAYTLSEKRSSLPWKTYAAASTIQHLQQALDSAPGKAARVPRPQALAFIFTGQGAQWFAMGIEQAPQSIWQLMGFSGRAESRCQRTDHVFARKLRVTTAYHSHHMQQISEGYLSSLADKWELRPGKPGVRMFSSVSAKPIDGTELGASYWVANLVSPINFSGAVTATATSGALGKRKTARKGSADAIVEIGPHAALQGPLKQILDSLGDKVLLQKLLGVRDERSTASEPAWRNYLRISEQPWIEHHQFQNTNIYPMAGMIVMAIEGLRQVETRTDVSGYHIRDVNIRSALVAPLDQTMETRLQLSPWRSGPNPEPEWFNVDKFKVGDRVFGMHAGCFQTRVRVDPRTFQRTPDRLGDEEAASLICTSATVVHSLIDVARLQRGESVLIHSAAGGVGQTAIRLAKYLGAEIFATVSSEKKKRLLIDEYGITESHIFNSRDYSFADGILRLTKQRGVDVVLNSLAGEALRRTWLCVAPFGRFIELGKRDIYDSNGLDMRPFLDNTTFSGLDILTQVINYPDRFEAIGKHVVELLKKGAIAPLDNLARYSFGEVSKAFRLMQSGSHVGKIALYPRPDDVVPVVPEGLETFRLSSGNTHVLVGGLGGIGRSVARLLVERGVRHLVFLSRSGDSRPEAWISGYDAVYSSMTAQDWNLSLRPKLVATRNLHDLLPADLDLLICLSSIAGIIGSRGQANYNAGNTYQDALAHDRAASGLASTSINLSLVVDVGVSTERSEVFQLLKDGGLLGMEENEVLNVIKAAVSGRTPTQVALGASTGGQLDKLAASDPYWFSDSRFALLSQLDRQGTTVNSAGGQDWKKLLAAATTPDEVYELVSGQTLEGVSNIIKADVQDMDSRKSLPCLGIDSLVAIEIRTWLLKEFQAHLSVFDIYEAWRGQACSNMLCTGYSTVDAFVQNRDIKEETSRQITADCQELLEYTSAARRFSLDMNGKSKDTMVSCGERLSCRLMVALLRDRNIPAEYVDLSDMIHGNDSDQRQPGFFYHAATVFGKRVAADLATVGSVNPRCSF
ncbi:hypothetical protein F66182_6423 [Fusarium sp. NRRL 66182]|nr:hypothetical protein F66182_6423 [Fusarium sp. NRRL 66182]